MSDMADSFSAEVGQSEDRAQNMNSPLWQSVIHIDLVAFVLGLLPALCLGFGIQAIGAHNNWWVGDPNSNDGEETFATFLGVFGVIPVLAGMTIAVARSARKRKKPAALLNVVNAFAFVAVYTVLGIWAFQPAPLSQ
jgi:hypothetical protein